MQSVPPRGSGWVRSGFDHGSWLHTHPPPRGGTDCIQVRLRSFTSRLNREEELNRRVAEYAETQRKLISSPSAPQQSHSHRRLSSALRAFRVSRPRWLDSLTDQT